MLRFTDVLAKTGWKRSFAPVRFLGFDISWLVMKEVFISPYNHRTYSFDEALRQEAPYHPEIMGASQAA